MRAILKRIYDAEALGGVIGSMKNVQARVATFSSRTNKKSNSQLDAR
jgi:hypothetical protein